MWAFLKKAARALVKRVDIQVRLKDRPEDGR